ncbi:MAG: GNAT family N-acetyltransferase [Bacilli bacterium]
MTIRKAASTDARELAVVHVDSWRSTYRGIVSDDFLESMSYDDREARWRSTLDAIGAENAKRIVFVAEDHDGRIVGFAMGGPHRDPDPEYTGDRKFISIWLRVQHLVRRDLALWVVREQGEYAVIATSTQQVALFPFLGFYSISGSYVRPSK